MPVPKAVRRAARAGGNVGGSPAGTKLESSPSPTQEETRSYHYVLEVKSARLKENRKGPYLSVTGLGTDGKLYWAPLDPSFKVEKGEMITLKGKVKGTFGGEDGKPLYHKILGPRYFPEVAREMIPRPEMSAPLKKALKFEGEDAEALQNTLEAIVKQHGIGKILSVLGEIT